MQNYNEKNLKKVLTNSNKNDILKSEKRKGRTEKVQRYKAMMRTEKINNTYVKRFGNNKGQMIAYYNKVIKNPNIKRAYCGWFNDTETGDYTVAYVYK